MIWTTAFWKGASERLLKTFAQVLVGYIAVGSTGILDLDWRGALSVSVAGALASLLTSIGNADFTAGTGLTDADGYTAPDAEMPYTEADAADLPTHRADG